MHVLKFNLLMYLCTRNCLVSTCMYVPTHVIECSYYVTMYVRSGHNSIKGPNVLASISALDSCERGQQYVNL